MISDLKHKRKTAGFIRTNSSKALPTFKIETKNQSSDDFSSFQNTPNHYHREQSDSQFSPYKNNVLVAHYQPTRPPLPPKHQMERPGSNSKLKSKQKQVYRLRQIQKQQRIERQREQMQRIKELKQKQAKNIKKRQNSGEKNKQQEFLFSNEKLKRNYQTSCSNVQPDSPNCGKIIDRSQIKSKREEQMRENLRKRMEVQKELAQIGKVCDQIEQIKRESFGKSNGSKSVEKYNIQDKRLKSAFSREKITKNQSQQYSTSNMVSPKQKIGSQIIKNKTVSQLRSNIGNKSNQKYKQYSFQSEEDENFSQSSFQHEQLQIQLKHKSHSKEKQKKQANKLQNASFACEQTFKPNANQQILTSIQQYKKLHPQIQNIKKTKSKNDENIRQQNINYQNNENKVRLEHQKARNKFISTKQQQPYVCENENEEEEIEEQQSEEQLIDQYPVDEFKKTTIQQKIHQENSQRQPKLKTIENESGVYKAKGGICFDLDVGQFTYVQPKFIQKNQVQATPIGRKPKKTNTKQQILKRRQMAKNYDKIARAKVFSGF